MWKALQPTHETVERRQTTCDVGACLCCTTVYGRTSTAKNEEQQSNFCVRILIHTGYWVVALGFKLELFVACCLCTFQGAQPTTNHLGATFEDRLVRPT